MKRLLSITAGAALLIGAPIAHAASTGVGSSGSQSNNTTPGAIGGTQQSLEPTNPTGDLNPTGPRVDVSPGTVGGPSYSPSSKRPVGSDTGSGPTGSDGG